MVAINFTMFPASVAQGLVEEAAKNIHHQEQQDGFLPCLWGNLDKHNKRRLMETAKAALSVIPKGGK